MFFVDRVKEIFQYYDLYLKKDRTAWFLFFLAIGIACFFKVYPIMLFLTVFEGLFIASMVYYLRVPVMLFSAIGSARFRDIFRILSVIFIWVGVPLLYIFCEFHKEINKYITSGQYKEDKELLLFIAVFFAGVLKNAWVLSYKEYATKNEAEKQALSYKIKKTEQSFINKWAFKEVVIELMPVGFLMWMILFFIGLFLFQMEISFLSTTLKEALMGSLLIASTLPIETKKQFNLYKH